MHPDDKEGSSYMSCLASPLLYNVSEWRKHLRSLWTGTGEVREGYGRGTGGVRERGLTLAAGSNKRPLDPWLKVAT